MTLKELRRGDKFRVIKVTLSGEIGRRLVDMGITSGVEGEMMRCALFGDPLHIKVRGYNLTLRKSEAGGIEIELLQSGKHQKRKRRGRRFMNRNNDEVKGE